MVALDVARLRPVAFPLWNGATPPAVIQLGDQVPSRELRDRVIRLVEREAMRRV